MEVNANGATLCFVIFCLFIVGLIYNYSSNIYTFRLTISANMVSTVRTVLHHVFQTIHGVFVGLHH